VVPWPPWAGELTRELVVGKCVCLMLGSGSGFECW
jgi:hypothetical protein